jgi:hypothetical protein
MLRTDFDAAVGYLEVANKYAPGHRGIIKSLGYCYVWLGDFDNAQRLLAEIPEASEELGIYVWWWGESRTDLIFLKEHYRWFQDWFPGRPSVDRK